MSGKSTDGTPSHSTHGELTFEQLDTVAGGTGMFVAGRDSHGHVLDGFQMTQASVLQAAPPSQPVEHAPTAIGDHVETATPVTAIEYGLISALVVLAQGRVAETAGVDFVSMLRTVDTHLTQSGGQVAAPVGVPTTMPHGPAEVPPIAGGPGLGGVAGGIVHEAPDRTAPVERSAPVRPVGLQR